MNTKRSPPPPEKNYYQYWVFDLSPEYTCLPEAILIPDTLYGVLFESYGGFRCATEKEFFPTQSIYRYNVADGGARLSEEEANKPFNHQIRDSFFIPYEHHNNYFISIFNFPNVLLSFGNTCDAVFAKDASSEEAVRIQKLIYRMQELAEFIAVNGDVQEKVYKYVKRGIQKKSASSSDWKDCLELCEYIYDCIDTLLKENFSLQLQHLFKEINYGEKLLSDAFHECVDVKNKVMFNNNSFESAFASIFFPKLPNKQPEYQIANRSGEGDVENMENIKKAQVEAQENEPGQTPPELEKYKE